jgi:hypothetical protein
MGSFVSDDSVAGRVSRERNLSDVPSDETLTGAEHTLLARMILDKEPAQIRRVQDDDPDLVREWVSLLKAQQLNEPTGPAGAALNHIRLCTLSPLRFAAE